MTALSVFLSQVIEGRLPGTFGHGVYCRRILFLQEHIVSLLLHSALKTGSVKTLTLWHLDKEDKAVACIIKGL